MPKFAVLVSASAESETGAMPKTSELMEMGAYNDKLKEAGVLQVADGFLDSSKGVRINFSSEGPGKPQPGPFGLENLVAGFWVWEVESLEKAIEWANKIPFKDGRVEIRRIAGEEDFPKEYIEEEKKRKEKSG